MSAPELLAILGRSWSRLVLWPGGLALLLLLWARWRGRPSTGHALALAGPWLALALLPLPGAADTPLALDALVAAALLELPLLLAESPSIGGAPSPQRKEETKVTKAWNGRVWGYALALIGVWLLSRASGSVVLGRLMLPPDGAPLWAAWAHWLGAALLLAALVPLLRGTLRPPDPALRLRAIGWTLLAALPVIGLI